MPFLERPRGSFATILWQIADVLPLMSRRRGTGRLPQIVPRFMERERWGEVDRKGRVCQKVGAQKNPLLEGIKQWTLSQTTSNKLT